MKLAIALEGANVANHFGHCNDFRIIEIEDKNVINSVDVHDEVETHHARAQFLKNKGVDVLIINGMGQAAYDRFASLGIPCLRALMLSADAALEAFLKGQLTQSVIPHASHTHSHDHDHHAH